VCVGGWVEAGARTRPARRLADALDLRLAGLDVLVQLVRGNIGEAAHVLTAEEPSGMARDGEGPLQHWDDGETPHPGAL
jgi:hypothetical protein